VTIYLNAVLAAVLLAALILQLSNQHPADRGGSFNLRAIARAMVGVYLLSVAAKPFAGAAPEAVQTALLFGIAVLLLVRWRRRADVAPSPEPHR
jgi:hypothetical protein